MLLKIRKRERSLQKCPWATTLTIWSYYFALISERMKECEPQLCLFLSNPKYETGQKEPCFRKERRYNINAGLHSMGIMLKLQHI